MKPNDYKGYAEPFGSLDRENKRLRRALQQVLDERARDPQPHSSAWLITASAMETVERTLKS
jgi:hypothetical protein